MSDAAEAESPNESKAFSKRPEVIADNRHGTKVKLWNNQSEKGPFQTVSIERSYKPQGSDDWKTQQVTLSADDLLFVAHALQSGHARIMEKHLGQQRPAKSV